MAIVTPTGRIGRIKQRVQALNPRTKHWVLSSTRTGRFLNVKADTNPFRAVRHSKPKAK